MRLPRDLSGEDLAKKLKKLGYAPTRQVGSHVRLTTREGGEHHVTIPMHGSLRLGTLSGIITEVAAHFGVSKDELAKKLF